MNKIEPLVTDKIYQGKGKVLEVLTNNKFEVVEQIYIGKELTSTREGQELIDYLINLFSPKVQIVAGRSLHYNYFNGHDFQGSSYLIAMLNHWLLNSKQTIKIENDATPLEVRGNGEKDISVCVSYQGEGIEILEVDTERIVQLDIPDTFKYRALFTHYLVERYKNIKIMEYKGIGYTEEWKVTKVFKRLDKKTVESRINQVYMEFLELKRDGKISFNDDYFNELLGIEEVKKEEEKQEVKAILEGW